MHKSIVQLSWYFIVPLQVLEKAQRLRLLPALRSPVTLLLSVPDLSRITPRRNHSSDVLLRGKVEVISAETEVLVDSLRMSQHSLLIFTTKELSY